MPKTTLRGRVSFHNSNGWCEHRQSKDQKIRVCLYPRNKNVRLWIGDRLVFSYSFAYIAQARYQFDAFKAAFSL